MNQQEMQAAVDELAISMAKQGLADPAPVIAFQPLKNARLSLYYADPTAPDGYDMLYFGEPLLRESIAAAQKWIAEQPKRDARNLYEFKHALQWAEKAINETISKGHAANIDVEFLNPLTELSQKLAENALTDQREGV